MMCGLPNSGTMWLDLLYPPVVPHSSTRAMYMSFSNHLNRVSPYCWHRLPHSMRVSEQLDFLSGTWLLRREKVEAARAFKAWTQKSWNISSITFYQSKQLRGQPRFKGRGDLMEHVYTGMGGVVGSHLWWLFVTVRKGPFPSCKGMMGGDRLFTHNTLSTAPPLSSLSFLYTNL